MPGTRFGHTLLGTILLLVSFDAYASRCKAIGFSLSGAEEAFAEAELVFVGTLRSRSYQDPAAQLSGRRGMAAKSVRRCQEADDDATELTSVSIIGPQPSPWVGQFVVDRTYKGEPPQQIQVRIVEELAVGGRYLVYAYRRNGDLDASGYCNGSAFAYAPELQEHLNYLDALPAAGAGGFVNLRLRGAHGPLKAARTLSFRGPDGEIRLRFDDLSGAHNFLSRSELLPAGRYRLLSVADPGYRYSCPNAGESSCDDLVVQDRAVTYWGIEIEPQAEVRINLLDAHGQPTPVDAQFAFVDASTGQPVAFERAATWDYSRRGIVGRIAPGRVIPVLLLSQFDQRGNYHSVRGQQRVYSAGKADWRQAQSFDVQPGDNQIEFVLPIERQPVVTRIDLEVVSSTYIFAMGSFGLKVWGERGAYAGTRDHTVTCQHQDTGACSLEMLGIPGQFWSLRMTGHQFFDLDPGQRLDSVLIEVVGPQVWDLKLIATPPTDALSGE